MVFSHAWRIAVLVVWLVSGIVQAQSIRFPWSGYAHDPQHDTIAPVASQPLNRIVWQTSVDLSVPASNTDELFIHYGSPLITRSNTVILPVKTGAAGGFEIKALNGATGRTNWVQLTDYVLPPHNWVPSFSPTLTPKNRLYFPGGGGTVYYCDTPDSTNAAPAIGQMAFYGLTNYLASSNTYLNAMFICTPITSDRYGNIFFGFQVIGSTLPNFHSGIARIDYNGTGTWIAASSTVTNATISQVAMNCAPALSNDHKTLYLGVNNGYSGYGYLVALDSRNLTPLASVRLKDVKTPANDANVDDDGTSSPTVGPDGDVYYGVLETPWYANNDRGWLLHFNSTLTQSKLPGAFGWDDTASIVPASAVPSYHGSSSYLLMTKYNNYADPPLNGDGVNKIAILDPQNSETDPVTGATVMNEVLTIAGPTPDLGLRDASHPNAVREWCINSAVVDPATRSVLVNNEDGRLYRWDLASNTLSETNVLTSGVGEAYTPTLVGVNGFVYAVNNAILFAIGQLTNTRMRFKPSILLLLALLLFTVSARADLAFVLTPVAQSGVGNNEVFFIGTLTNTSLTDKLFLNNIQFGFINAATNYLSADTNAFFANVPGILLPGEIYSDAVFGISVAPATPPGQYFCLVTIQGGADIFAATSLSNQTAQVSLPAAALSLTVTGTNLVLSWPTPPGSFVLQHNYDLTTTNWTAATNLPVAGEGQNHVIVNPVITNQFYRLKYP